MRTPTIHRNGTDSETLMRQALGAMDALREALEALEAAAPNARDYYPQGPAAFAEAAKEHADRVARVQAVRAEMNAIVESVDSQG